MATSVKLVSDNIIPNGRVLSPSKIRVLVPGRAVIGGSVWRHPDKPIITSVAEMEGSIVADTFGRKPIVKTRHERFLFTNDIISGEVDFLKPAGKETYYIRFADLADRPDRDGMPVTLWFNGVKIARKRQADAQVDVYAVTTDAKVITFKWHSGEPGNWDGFAVLFPCGLKAV